MTSHITTALEAGVLTINFNRADKKNAITADMYRAMSEAMHRAEADPEVRVILWSSTSEDFSTGNDLADFMANPSMDEHAPVSVFIRSLGEGTVPMVSAVPGLAVGIGSTLLLHCDFNILGESARLKMPFTDLGLVPEAGSSLLLPMIVGYQRAAKIALLGDTLDAQQALDFGLAHQVVADSELVTEAMKLAQRLADKPKTALRASRKLLRPEPEAFLKVMAEESAHFSAGLNSAAGKEAFTAFFERRAPDFRSCD
jgi:enoyl-CoA hydratase/carnithine racemase